MTPPDPYRHAPHDAESAREMRRVLVEYFDRDVSAVRRLDNVNARFSCVMAALMTGGMLAMAWLAISIAMDADRTLRGAQYSVARPVATDQALDEDSALDLTVAICGIESRVDCRNPDGVVRITGPVTCSAGNDKRGRALWRCVNR